LWCVVERTIVGNLVPLRQRCPEPFTTTFYRSLKLATPTGLS
jgi:hypothetical protein